MSLVRAAVTSGVAGTTGTAGILLGMVAAIKWPASNLAGYIVAGRILGASAATSAKVAAVGGPAVAGTLASLGVGAGVSALTIIGLLIVRKWKSHG
jgi:hypothetical protein